MPMEKVGPVLARMKKKNQPARPAPKPPMTFEELENNLKSQDLQFSSGGKNVPFYCGTIGKAPDRVLLFAHQRMVDELSSCKELFVDGTFTKVDEPCKQLVVFVTRYMSSVSKFRISFV